ncbi:MAG: hypothetical protein NDJ90_07560, partial [Oligoflexia bacterium]|nr:hypothetical protein [Oligoflexia bacterium]
PRQLRWMFRKLNSNDFAFEIKAPDLQDLRATMENNGKRMSLSVLVAGLFIAGSIVMQHPSARLIGEYPLVAVVFFAVATFLLLRLLFR